MSKAVDEAWDALRHDVFWTARRGDLGDGSIVVEDHRKAIEAAIRDDERAKVMSEIANQPKTPAQLHEEWLSSGRGVSTGGVMGRQED